MTNPAQRTEPSVSLRGWYWDSRLAKFNYILWRLNLVHMQKQLRTWPQVERFKERVDGWRAT